jgi:hypothetical protein
MMASKYIMMVSENHKVVWDILFPLTCNENEIVKHKIMAKAQARLTPKTNFIESKTNFIDFSRNLVELVPIFWASATRYVTRCRRVTYSVQPQRTLGATKMCGHGI